MTRIRLAALALALMLNPAAAHASDGWMEWLEKLSGPGPFGGKFPGWQVPVYCWPNQSILCWNDDGEAGKTVLLLHFGRSSTGLQRVFDDTPNDIRDIHALAIDPAVMFRLHRVMEVGASLAFIRFSGDRVDPFWKVGLTPVRITYTPLALVPAEGKWKVARRILKIWVEETYLAGSLNGADFGNPSSAFKSNGEWKTRWGAIIDLTPLLSLRR